MPFCGFSRSESDALSTDISGAQVSSNMNTCVSVAVSVSWDLREFSLIFLPSDLKKKTHNFESLEADWQ